MAESMDESQEETQEDIRTISLSQVGLHTTGMLVDRYVPRACYCLW